MSDNEETDVVDESWNSNEDDRSLSDYYSCSEDDQDIMDSSLSDFDLSGMLGSLLDGPDEHSFVDSVCR